MKVCKLTIFDLFQLAGAFVLYSSAWTFWLNLFYLDLIYQ